MSDHPDPESAGEPKLSTADLARSSVSADHAVEPRSFAAEEAAEEPLLPQSDAGDFRTRWANIQTSFVDEPRRAVEQADGLVAEAIKHLAETFANERCNLEAQWDRGDSVSTEDLRQALQRYRSFFTRLLSV
jgi:hypothetical protein